MHGIIMSITNPIASEPQIRIGIILPEDKRTSIKIQIPQNIKYKINDKLISSDLIIRCESNHLVINENISNKFILSSLNIDDYLTIESVPAGRGFHWESNIITKLKGNIIIKFSDGYILLINEIPLEKYLPYVATSEMNPDSPTALLEAQTIAARSWLLSNRNANHPDLDIDVCNDDCCQRYQGIVDVPLKSLQAIENTYGQVLMYKNIICDARYSKSCGGVSESFENAWGGKNIEYLSSIVDYKNKECEFDLRAESGFNQYLKSDFVAFCSPHFVSSNEINKYLGIVDASDSYYRWKIDYTQDELTEILNNKLNLKIKEITDIISQKRGFSGRIVKLKIQYIDNSNELTSLTINSEYNIRNALHEKFLYSSAIIIEKEIDKNRNINKFKFKGAGWGHGVGLCQIGALGMALDGYSSENILKHYFKDSQIEKIY